MSARITDRQYRAAVDSRVTLKRCRKAKPLEKEVQASIMAYLESVGAYAIRINSGAMPGEYKGKRRFIRFTSRPGCSDILACWRGRFVAIECKRPGNHCTFAQQQFLADVRRAGGIALAAVCVDDVRREFGL